MGTQRYIITAAQNATPVHRGFWGSLRQYAKHTGAELLVVPVRYKNPTSIWSQQQEDDDWWAAETVAHHVADRRHLAKHCALLADVRIQPTASEPLSGLEGLTGAQSVIVAHPQIALSTVATPRDQLPRILTTTGACTVPNYTRSKAGAKGEHHHSIGALVVEVEKGGRFHLRHIIASEDGSFHDLDRYYHPRGSRPNGGVAALVMGDSHVDFIDPKVVKATFSGKASMVHRLKPQLLVWHDVLDCYSVSHHHKRHPLTLYRKHHNGHDNLDAEVQRCLDFIDRHSPSFCQNVIVPSNHVDHLARWWEETDPREDHENGLLWAELYLATRKAALAGHSLDPFVYLAKRRMACAERTLFLGRDEGLAVHGVELGFHGDQGPNGSRGSIKALAKTAGKSIVGHSHSPGIYQGCYQVGTSSRFDLEYVSGPSSWLQTHCVLYKNGKRALLHIIDGAWHA